MASDDSEEKLLRSVALQNANSILAARRRAERELIAAKEALETKTEELAQSLAMLQATLESTTNGILVTDGDGRVTNFNEKYLALWRIAPELMDTRDHRLLLKVGARYFKDRRQFVARIEEIYATSPPESFDLLELTDGRCIERHSKIQMVNGQCAGRVWSFHEVTMHRHAEKALREETRILELLNETGTLIASQLDLQSLLQTVTDAATQLAGAKFGAFFYNACDGNGESYMLYTLSGAPREAFENFEMPRNTAVFGPTFRGEGVVRLDDVTTDHRYGRNPPHYGMPKGHLPVRSYLAVPVISRTGEVIGGLFMGHPQPGVFAERAERVLVGVAAQAAIAIDNARLYQAAQEEIANRERAEAALRAADRQKDEFLATLAHELRNPLAPIRQAALVSRAPEATPAQKRWSQEVIDRQVEHMSLLLDDLLDVSRITRGTLALRMQELELATVIDAAVETARPIIDAKRHTLSIEMPREPVQLHADPLRLAQVLSNLLTNAAKYTDPEGHIRLIAACEPEQIVLSVADDGIGMSSETLPSIFRMFSQVKTAQDRSDGGLGIGLAITKGLVELHGGTIEGKSAGLGQGSEFIVRLPRRGSGAAETSQVGRT